MSLTEFVKQRLPEGVEVMRISIIMLTNYEGLPKNQLYEKIVKEVFA